MRSIHWDKVAGEYFDEIMSSPFIKGVNNPIFKMLKSLKNTRNKSVLEIGCGIGTLIPFLSKHFKKVTAIDISRKMIEKAQSSGEYNNVRFKIMDAVNITRLKEKFDVVVCINSILMPNIVKVNKVLAGINKVLKDNGRIVGIFPSFDAIIYQSIVTFDKEYDKRKDRKKARRATNRIIASRLHDFIYGFVYAKEEKNKQKHYFSFELEYRLKKAGFKKIKLGKIYYPWSVSEDPYPSRFKDDLYEKLWDWTVTAHKA